MKIPTALTLFLAVAGSFTVAGQPYYWPVPAPKIIQDFACEGCITLPEGSCHPGTTHGYHNGIDIVRGLDQDAGCLKDVFPVAAGMVRRTVEGCPDNNLDCARGYGNHVILEHRPPGHPEGPLYSLYAHLSEVSVSLGDYIPDPATSIGKMGKSGFAQGCHLHLALLAFNPGFLDAYNEEVGPALSQAGVCAYPGDYPTVACSGTSDCPDPRHLFMSIAFRIAGSGDIPVRIAPTDSAQLITSIQGGQTYIITDVANVSGELWYLIMIPSDDGPTGRYDGAVTDDETYGWIKPGGGGSPSSGQQIEVVGTTAGPRGAAVYLNTNRSTEITRVWGGQRYWVSTVQIAPDCDSPWLSISVPRDRGNGASLTGWICSSDILPDTCGFSGQESIEGCSSPISVNLQATPSTGSTPLNEVDLKATVSGSPGSTTYTFYCNRSDSGTDIRPGFADQFINTQLNPQTAVNACSYPNAGTYTPKVIVQRGNQVTEDRTTITVTQSSGTCWPLTLLRNNSGGGSFPLVSDPNSPGCPTGKYRKGFEILTTVVPNSGWRVRNWSGTVNNSSAAITNRIVMPDGAHSVQVNYEIGNPTCYELDRDHTGDGDNPDPAPNNSTACSTGEYVAGELIIVEADPDSGWTVEEWDGTINDSSTSTRNSVIMPDRDHTVEVHYERSESEEYELTIRFLGTGEGYVTSSPGPINCGNYSGSGSNCDHTYDEDTRVELTAHARSGSTFTSWAGDSDCTDGVVRIDEDMICRARFSANGTCRPLTLWAFGEGAEPVASPSNSSGCSAGYYTAGANITLAAQAAPAWRVIGWEGTSNDSSMASTNSLVMPNFEETVTVNYGRTDGRPNVETLDEVTVANDFAYVSGRWNPNGYSLTHYIAYGTTPGYGSTTHNWIRPPSFETVEYRVKIEFLSCGTTYFAAAVGVGAQGTVYGERVSFTTLPCPISKPTATTDPPDHITETSLRLRGTVNARGLPTEAWFEWGTSAGLGGVTPRQLVGSLSGDLPLTQTLLDLDCHTKYYARIVAENSEGRTDGDTIPQSTAPCSLSASFTASQVAGVAPLSVTFTDTSEGQATEWLWIFGDGTSSSQQHPVHVYEFPGTYTVRFRASRSASSSVTFRTGLVRVKAPIESILPATVNITRLGQTLSSGLAQIVGPDPAEDFGSSLSAADIAVLDKPAIIVGAPNADPEGRSDAGRTTIVFPNVIPRSTHVLELATTAHATVLGRDEGDYHSATMASGDLNGDGLADLITGAERANPTPVPRQGEVNIIYGGAALPTFNRIDLLSPPLNGIAMTSVQGDSSDELFGNTVSTGDVTGDGRQDLVIGSYFASPPFGESNSGEIFILHGDSRLWHSRVVPLNTLGDSPPFNVTWIAGEYQFDAFGKDITIGDVNGDGINDVIVAAEYASPFGRQLAGQVYIIYGSEEFKNVDRHYLASGDTSIEVTRIAGPIADTNIGFRLSSGDLNGDGFAEVVILPFRRSGFGGAVAWIVHGSEDISSQRVIDLADDKVARIDSARYVRLDEVHTADVTGDGVDDILLSSTEVPSFRSKVSVIPGGSQIHPGVRFGLDYGDGFEISELRSSEYPFGFGQSISSADIDRNGSTDILIGANKRPLSGPTFGTEGSIFVIYPEKLDPENLLFRDGFESGDVSVWQ